MRAPAPDADLAATSGAGDRKRGDFKDPVERSIGLLRQFSARSKLQFLAFVVLSAIFELASTWVLQALILFLFTPDNRAATALGRLSSNSGLPLGLSQFATLVAILIFFVFKNGVLFVLWRAITYRLGLEQHDFSVRLFERYLRAPYLRHVDRSKMTLLQNLNVAATQVFIFSILPLLQIVVEVIVAAGILAYLLVTSPIATFALLIWIAIAFALFRLAIARAAGATGLKQRETLGRMLGVVQEAFRDIKSIRLWGLEKALAKVFDETSRPFATAWSEARVLQQVPRFMLEPILIGALVAFAATLAAMRVSREAVLLDLSIFAAAGVRLLPGANRAIALLHTMTFYQADLNAVWADIGEPVEALEDRPAGALPPPFAHSIRIEGVSAVYDEGRKVVLSGVDLEVARGDKVAVIGRSGGGKTTLLNVLLGFVPPSGGRILFDGEAVSPMSRLRRSATAFVPQDIFLIEESIRANVAFGVPAAEVEDAEVHECLLLAHLGDLVSQLPAGIHTRVGDDGAKLSGGERQRLALARALYQRPSFLVLDEATSQLDIESEAIVLDQLFAHFPDLTVVMVTHRAANASHFSRKLRVEDGKVFELV